MLLTLWLPSAGSHLTGKKKAKLDAWEYPQHLDMMVTPAPASATFSHHTCCSAQAFRYFMWQDCAVFVRSSQCKKFELDGWCPFHHPYEGSVSVSLSGQLVGAATADVLHREWLQAARAGDLSLLVDLLKGGPGLPKLDIDYVAEPGTVGLDMDLQGKSAASICAKLGYCEALEMLLSRGASRRVSPPCVASLQ